MRTITQLFVKMLDRMQIRFQRARSGSILVLVVVLVVLLALIGTASLSTTQGDRYIAVQNSANTQIDLIVQGTIEMAKATIIGDLFSGAGYRPLDAAGTFTVGDYEHFDAYDLTNQNDATTNPIQFYDSWLSPRAPTAYPFSGGSPMPAWSNLGIMPGIKTFESPLAMELRAGAGNLGLSVNDLAVSKVYDNRVSYFTGVPRILEPNFVYPYGFTDGRSFPAFNLPRTAGGTRFVLAGDADGDGIADSGLFRFPVGEIDGVTYYGSIRIIDNNSAININTAWSASSDFGFGGANPPPVDALGNSVGSENNLGIFPSHIGLLEMMHNPLAPPVPAVGPASSEMAAINNYRNAGQTHVQNVTDEAIGPRSDFMWNTQGEAYAFQLARRLQNPGRITGTTPYKTFESGEATTLAYRFGLQNRDASPSPLERLTSAAVQPDSIYESAGNDDLNNTATTAVFGPNRQTYLSNQHGIAAWFDDNFHFEGFIAPSITIFGPSANTPATSGLLPHSGMTYKRSLRPFLTTSNPVSNAIRIRSWDGLGSISLPSTSTTNFARRLIHPGAPLDKRYSYMTPYGSDPDPNKLKPVKTNPNTATFDELWRAYWCVMMENNQGTLTSGTPFSGGGDQNAPYTGMGFDHTGAGGQFASSSTTQTQRMFRSPLRDPNPTPAFMSPKETVLLRSAIAAVQTMQMRGPAPNHASNPLVQDQPTMYERLEFQPNPQRTLFNDKYVRFTLFGNTPQPFITEVFVWRDTKTKDPIGGSATNQVPYVAIELYNPYSVPITLSSKMSLRTVNRTSGQIYNGSAMTVSPPLHTFSNEVIDPGKFLLIDNGNSMQFLPANIERPQSPQPLQVDLTQAIENGGRELILLEELDDDLNSGTPLLKPLDSFDFHGFLVDTNRMTWWHYARPCGDTTRWQCVYPGRYSVHGVANRSRHQGTDWKEWVPDDNTGAARNTDPGFDVPYQPTLGRASATNFSNGADPNYRQTIPQALPIPLNDLDFGGPNKKIDITGNKFPYGGFMRDGDILQVPYVGAYTITLHTIDGDPSPGMLVDMNSVSMDAAFAEDSDTNDDSSFGATGPREHVGRFVPVRMGAIGGHAIDDYDPMHANHRYAWAKDLFDYFTVNTPSHDFLPQYPMQREWRDLGGQQKVFFKGSLFSVFTGVDHQIWVCNSTGQATAGASPDPGTFTQLVALTAKSVKNGKNSASQVVAGVLDETENDVGVQGLININTAPWKVLSAVPWVRRGSDRFTFDDHSKAFSVGGNNRDDNEDIARAIVGWRDGDAVATTTARAQGPFRSLFDLYRVRPLGVSSGEYVFDLVQNTLAPPTGTEPDDSLGDFSPMNGNPLTTSQTDGSRFDFEERFWLLTKVSNLLTVRSDSFTVYIQVQGWRGVGTLKPELAVQRRAAFMLDRSGVTAGSDEPSAPPFPNE